MSYIKPQNAIIDNELLRSPTENAVFDALALKQDAGNYITQLSGEVTASGPGIASATISSLAVTNSKLALMVTGTIKGNNSGIPASPSDLNGTTVTSMLDVFLPDTGSGGLKGLVPAPTASDSTKYLRGDGSWDAISVPASANPYLSNLMSPTAINQVLLGLDGSASAPAYSFTSDSNTGIYRSGSDTLNFSTGGSNRLQVESGGSVKLMSASSADILWDTDGSGNIGASGLNRPDSVYIKTALNLNSLAASAILGSDASKNVISLDASTATSYLNNFVGDGGSGGIKGLVPAPSAGYGVDRYLKADGSWSTIPSGMSNPMTTIGDVIVGGIAGTPTRLALGSVDKVLVSNGTTVTYQYAGLGGGNFGTGNIILGAGLPVGFTSTNNLIIGEGTIPTLKQGGSFNQDANTLLGKAISLSGNFTRATVAVGYGASVNGESSIAIGAGSSATGGIAIGQNRNASLYSVNIGGAVANYGVSIGYDSNVFGSGLNSVSIGYRSTAGTGNNCISIGYLAGAYNQYNKNGNDTIVVGANSGNAMTTSSSAIIIGNSSAAALTTGSNNTIIGHAAATSLTSGFSNVVLGQASAPNLVGGSQNIIIGKTNTTPAYNGNDSVLIGHNSAAEAGKSIAIGTNSIAGYNGSEKQIAIGYGCQVISCDSSTFIGSDSVGNGADYCVAVGKGISIIQAAGHATYNTVLGNNVGMVLRGSNNTILGAYAANTITTNADNNTVVGKSAGSTLTSGSGNLFLGYLSGKYNTTQNNEFFVDNQDRTDYNGQKLKSLLYGVFNNVETSQTLAINAQTKLSFGVQIAAKTGATKITTNTSINLYDHYIGVDTATPAVAITVTLPSAATAGAGKLFIIKDEGGSALTYNIIIARNGSDKIEGALSNLTLANNREAAYLVSDGVDNWNRI